ncbi:unnamed protein product [Closterium sp. NIES-53]
MTLRPSIAPQHVPLPSPPASSLPACPDPESDSLRAASPTVTRFWVTVVTDPSFESNAASSLVAELVDFAAACRLDYATSLLAESGSASICPPSLRGECALGTDVLEDSQEEFECFAVALPHLVSMLLAPEGDPDAPDIPTPRSYAEAIEGTYVDEVPSPGVNIVCGMWIFRVKRPPGSPPVFKARYVARGFSQRQGVDFFHTFSPTPKVTTLWVLLHVAAQRDYELHSLDFSTAFLQGSLHEEIWLRRPPCFTGTTLAALGFAPSTADPSLFQRTDTALPPFYVLVYVDDLVFATADTEALAHMKSELQKRHTCTDLGELTSYLGLRITRDRAQHTISLTQSHMVQQILQRFGFTYSSPQSTPLPTSHSLSAPPFGRVRAAAGGSTVAEGGSRICMASSSAPLCRPPLTSLIPPTPLSSPPLPHTHSNKCCSGERKREGRERLLVVHTRHPHIAPPSTAETAKGKGGGGAALAVAGAGAGGGAGVGSGAGAGAGCRRWRWRFRLRSALAQAGWRWRWRWRQSLALALAVRAGTGAYDGQGDERDGRDKRGTQRAERRAMTGWDEQAHRARQGRARWA